MEKNQLYFGDNLDVLRKYVENESVDLVYLDPPFNSNRNYSVIFNRNGQVDVDNTAQIQAFEDTWHWTSVTEEQFTELIATAPGRLADAISAARTLLGENDALAYLVNMAPRLQELYRVLKPTGSLYLHCDPTMSHYLKALLDSIFDARNFLSEVIWQRTATKGDALRKYGAVHDVLLVYRKGDGYTFNPVFAEQDGAYQGRFNLDDDDGRGPYRLAPLDSPNPRPNLTYDYKGYAPPVKGWRVSREVMEQLDEEGRLAFPKKSTGRIARKHYLQEQQGRKVTDVWTDIAPLQGASAEKLGYPTQKPLALLERVLSASSNAGDVVLDPFCGCGTAIDAAQKLGRRWIGIDITFISVDLIEKRLLNTYGPEIANTYRVNGIPQDLAAARALFNQSAFEFERWAVAMVGGQPNQKQVGDKGIDGVARFPTDARGGIGKILVSVKGGQTINPSMVRDLIGTVEAQKAAMGIIVTLQPATKGFQDAVDHGGVYTHPGDGRTFPKIQHVTVAELLKGRRLRVPPLMLPYIAAKKQTMTYDSDSLF